MRMNTLPTVSYRPAQRLHLLSLLAQLASRKVSGCLQVFDGSTTWSLYLEQGALFYASSSVEPFNRLDRQLRRLNAQAPGLASPVRVQVRLLFEMQLEDYPVGVRDYEAINWLVQQQHLDVAQAAQLIQQLAQEVLGSLLPVQQGSYDMVEHDPLVGQPRFCRLDLRGLVERCQSQLEQRPSSSSLPTPRLYQPETSSTEQPISNRRGLPRSQPRPSRPPVNAAPSHPSAKSTYTVACIDDSPTVLAAIESFLDDKLFKVLQINNPVSALMQVIREQPDLILLDVTMPSLDGYELCSLLRRHPAFKQTPIIMVTGNTGLIDRAKAKLVGSSGYLTKPFTQPDLLKMVFKHLA